MSVQSKTIVMITHYVLTRMDPTHANVKWVSPVMAIPAMMSTSVMPVLVKVMKLVKTRSDHTNALHAIAV